jgi:hypothetical protein
MLERLAICPGMRRFCKHGTGRGLQYPAWPIESRQLASESNSGWMMRSWTVSSAGELDETEAVAKWIGKTDAT